MVRGLRGTDGVGGGPARASGSEPPGSPIGSPGSFDFDLGDEDEDQAGAAAAARSPLTDSDVAGSSDHEAGGATGGLARRQVGPDPHAVLVVTS